MKENWFAILMFSVIFGILGFLLGRTTCTTCCVSSHQCCAPSDACCAPGAAACGTKGENVFIKEIHGDHDHMGEVEVIIHDLESGDWTGDTTIVVEGMTIKMTKSEGGEIDVQVEMDDDMEWHSHDGEGEHHHHDGEDGEKKIKKEIKIIKESAEE